MARKRSVEIREELEELEQLRRYYAGKPQEGRLLFLCFLKEDPTCSIIEASRKAGLSERRGERLWGTYRKKGLKGMLERREWGESEEDGMQTGATTDGESGAHSFSEGSSFFTFMCEVARIAEMTDVKEWLFGLRRALLRFLPDVDHIILNIQHSLELSNLPQGFSDTIYRHHVLPDGTYVSTFKNPDGDGSPVVEPHQRILQEGKSQGIPFDRYHPPVCLDLYLDSGKRTLHQLDDYFTYLGTVILLRSIDRSPFPPSLSDNAEKLRPVLSYIFSGFIARRHQSNEIEYTVQKVFARMKSEQRLTIRETNVLRLEVYGHSYREIADILNISLSTVKTHIRSAYKKLGVGSISEVFGKFFSPRWNIGRNGEEEKPA